MTSSQNILSGQRLGTKDYALIGVFAALMAICSWISIPATVPFTMQTFAVFLTIGLLGGKRGSIAIAIYLLLGASGIPVFSGFSGGLGYMMGPTGGYIIGFLFSALIMWAIEKVLGKSLGVLVASMVVGLLVCDAFGTAWFMVVYTKSNETIGLATALTWCVIPYIIPDALKIALAALLTRRLRRFISAV